MNIPTVNFSVPGPLSNSTSNSPLIYVVDEDDSCRNSLKTLLDQKNHRVELYASPGSFFENLDVQQHGCMILDYKLPSLTGIELVDQVRKRGCPMPFVVVTAHASVPITVALMKMGAITVLEKPFDSSELLKCIDWAIQLDLQERVLMLRKITMQNRLERLTARETEVLNFIRSGMLSKQIALELNISTKTVEVHRSNIIRKMEVESMISLLQALMFEGSVHCK